MKHTLLIILLMISIVPGIVIGQDYSTQSGSEFCARQKQKASRQFLEDLNNTAPRHSFDVQKYTLNLNLYNCFKSPYPHTYNAVNRVYFRVDSTLTSVSFNAVSSSLAIDSVRLVGGALLTFNQSNNMLNITMDRTYNPNEYVDMKIYYRHIATSNDGGFYTYNGVVFTDCEPEGARLWMPCWDKPSDKALTDITVNTPTTVKLGSNGRLADSTVSGDTIWYHWVSRDPISTYLIVITGKVNYNLDIVYWHKPSNPIDSIPIRFYYNNGESYTSARNSIISMTNYYSSLFGEHPFEKNGFATLPSGSGFIWGGMENQTLTSLCANCWYTSVVCHEYAHQWFGDMITLGTWADVWLNEGFATFCEALWNGYTGGGYNAYKSSINSDASSYLSGNPGWPIYNPSWAIVTPDQNTLFNTAITYNKSACILHQLRYVLGDTAFFAFIKAYATDTVNFKFKNVTTQDFNNKLNSVTGQNYDWFFLWLTQANHPQYQNQYNITNLGNGTWRVNFLAKQGQTNSGFFPMKLPLRFTFSDATTDSAFVMNTVNNELFTFVFNKQPTTLQFDPWNMIVLKTASLTLGIENEFTETPSKFKLGQNYPNPFNPVTSINYEVPKDSKVKISVYDVKGGEIATLVNENKSAGRYTVSFNGTNLTSGIYFYRIQAGDFTDTRKMILTK
jgi:aminopeptidase N